MLPLLAVAALAAPPADKLSARQVYEKTLAGTCWVLTADGSGTGWVADRSRRLVVTNAHVVAGTDAVKLHFPARQDGQLLRQAADYLDRLAPVEGVVVDRDSNRDLALVRCDRLPTDAQELAAADDGATEGDEVRTVGGSAKGSDGFLWGNVRGEVRSVGTQSGRRGKPIRVVLTDLAINKGNSGGPLVDDRGRLVGVNASYRTDARSVSTHIDAREVVNFLQEAGRLVDPRTPGVFRARGLRRAAEGRHAAAAADFTAALQGNETDPALLVARGAAYRGLGDQTAALADLDAAVEHAPDHLPARVNRAEALMAAGFFPKALADAEAAVKIAPGRWEGFDIRGTVRSVLALGKRDAGLLQQAVSDFTRAVGLAPDVARLRANRAVALKNLGRRSEAADDLQAAAKLEPWNPDHPNALGELLYNQALRTKDEQQAAETLRLAVKQFVAAAEASDDAPGPLVNLGDALRRLGQHEGAAKAYAGVIGEPAGRTPSHLFRAYLGRGVCSRAMKEYAAAVRDFDKALAVKDSEADRETAAELLRHKAAAHRGLGEADEAAACLAKADKLDGTKPPAQQAAAPPKAAPPKGGGSIVGTWRFQAGNAKGQGDILMVFNANGHFSMSMALNAPGQPAQASTANGTFRYDGREVTFTEQDGSVMKRRARVDGNTLHLDLSGSGPDLPLTRQQ